MKGISNFDPINTKFYIHVCSTNPWPPGDGLAPGDSRCVLIFKYTYIFTLPILGPQLMGWLQVIVGVLRIVSLYQPLSIPDPIVVASQYSHI